MDDFILEYSVSFLCVRIIDWITVNLIMLDRQISCEAFCRPHIRKLNECRSLQIEERVFY